jgi:hypothetical protein
MEFEKPSAFPVKFLYSSEFERPAVFSVSFSLLK